MSHRSRFSWPISRKVQTVESVWSTSVFSWNLCSFFDDVDCRWSFSWRESLETINKSLECAGPSGVAKCLTFCANCRTTFLSLRSFIGQSLHILLPFPGGFTNVCFSNSLTLLWRHNYHIEISFVAQEICKRMFNLLSATNRKWLVWQEVACSGMSVNSHLRTTHAQQHWWLYNEVTLWNPTNEKRLNPN